MLLLISEMLPHHIFFFNYLTECEIIANFMNQCFISSYDQQQVSTITSVLNSDVTKSYDEQHVSHIERFSESPPHPLL
jgi:hypothetical protein